MYSIKIDANDKTTLYNFQKAGFYTVDCLVTYEYDSSKSRSLEQTIQDDYRMKYHKMIYLN